MVSPAPTVEVHALCTIKACDSIIHIPGRVGVDHVDEHHHAQPMCFINQRLQLVWRSTSAAYLCIPTPPPYPAAAQLSCSIEVSTQLLCSTKVTTQLLCSTKLIRHPTCVYPSTCLFVPYVPDGFCSRTSHAATYHKMETYPSFNAHFIFSKFQFENTFVVQTPMFLNHEQSRGGPTQCMHVVPYQFSSILHHARNNYTGIPNTVVTHRNSTQSLPSAPF